jgi:L-fuconolactonase
VKIAREVRSSGRNGVYVQARSMCRATGPVELRPVGEVEFANGVAAMSASATYGNTRICAGIVGHADLTPGSRVEPVLVALARTGGDRFRGIAISPLGTPTRPWVTRRT